MATLSVKEAFETIDNALSEISADRRTHVVLQTCLQNIQRALADAQARIKELEPDTTEVNEDA